MKYCWNNVSFDLSDEVIIAGMMYRFTSRHVFNVVELRSLPSVSMCISAHKNRSSGDVPICHTGVPSSTWGRQDIFLRL